MSKGKSFWHWYWIDSGRLETIKILMMFLSPLIIGVILDILFSVAGTYICTQIGGAIVTIMLFLLGVWHYFDEQKMEFERDMGGRDNQAQTTLEQVLESTRDEMGESN